jgi:hypothetical protein
MNSLLDTALDRSLVLGYSRIGFAWRRRGWPQHGGDLPRLNGRTVAVTGPTSGLGEATPSTSWERACSCSCAPASAVSS